MEKIKNTLINFVLDESGSMLAIKEGTMGGFNEYVNGMKQYGNKVRMTLTKFNSSDLSVVFSNIPVKDVPELTNSNYRPDTCTPLYDAIGVSILNTREAIKDKADKPAVLFVLMTDGLENASRNYDRQTIFKMIERQKTTDGWTFVFLGANQDSYASSEKIGVYSGNTENFMYSNKGMARAMCKLRSNTNAYLARGSVATKHFMDDPSEENDDKNNG
jgi:hypothetical protein